MPGTGIGRVSEVAGTYDINMAQKEGMVMFHDSFLVLSLLGVEYLCAFVDEKLDECLVGFHLVHACWSLSVAFGY